MLIPHRTFPAEKIVFHSKQEGKDHIYNDGRTNRNKGRVNKKFPDVRRRDGHFFSKPCTNSECLLFKKTFGVFNNANHDVINLFPILQDKHFF